MRLLLSEPQILYSASPNKLAMLDDDDTSSLPSTASVHIASRDDLAHFLRSRSRVIRLFNLPPNPSLALPRLFNAAVPMPLTTWSLREEYGGKPPGEEDSIWAVFRSHEEAKVALSLSGLAISVATALEHDLEPYAKLRKFDMRKPMPMPVAQPPYLSYTLQSIPPQYLRSSISSPDLRHSRQSQPQINQEYQLSTNPPNIRTSFRTGDWICHNPACAAHNFTRNPICIGCSTPRPSVPGTSTTVPGVRSGDISPSPGTNSPLSPGSPSPPGSLLYNPNNQNQNPTLHIASPRFLQNNHHHHNLNQTFPNNGNGSLSLPSSPSSNINPSFSFTSSLQSISSLTTNPAPSLSSLTSSASGTTTQLTLGPGNQLRPLPSILTPTGRAFAVGGRVRNVSPNPLSPCVLFWPDNEDLPSEGQVRPVYSGTQPPIMNTGNRGPIEHQPGDWVCLKCDYLNWRRRKVCGSCFPYAEGNLDGVSASVQAERVALLTSVLVAQQQQQQQQQAQQNQQTNQVQSVGLLHSYPSSTYDPLQMQVQLSMHAPSSSPSSTPAYDERIYFPYASGVGVSGGSAGSPDLSLLQQQLQHSHQQPHHHQQGQTQISSIASSSHHASSSTSTAASTSVSNSASSASASVIHQSLPHLAQDRQSERDWDRDASASAIHSRANLAVAGGNNGVGANSNLHLHGAEQYYGGVINFAGASSAALSGVSVGASQAQAQRTLSRSSSLADLVAANVASNVNVNGAANGPSGSTGSVSNSPSSFGWNNSPTRSTTSGSASGHGSGQLRTKSSLSSMKSMTSSSQFVVGTPPPFPQLQFNAFRERDAHSPPNANAAPGSHGPLLPSFFADVLQSPFSSPRGLRGSSIEESDEDEVEHGRGFSGDWMKSDDFNSSSLIGASSAASMGLKEDELDDVVYPSSRSSRRTSSHLSLSLSGELKDLHDGAEKIVWNGRRDVGNRAVGEEWSDSGSGSRGGSRGGSRRGSQENLNGKNKDLEKDLKEAIGAIGELTMGRK